MDGMSCDSSSEMSSPKKQNDIAKRMPELCSEDDDYDPYENGDIRVTQKENENVKRCSRQSAQEAAKKLKRNFATSSEENDDEWSHFNEEFSNWILWPPLE